MRARNGTSQDAKRAREALMKQLAELPLSNKARGKVQASQRKAASVKTEPVKEAAAAKA